MKLLPEDYRRQVGRLQAARCKYASGDAAAQPAALESTDNPTVIKYNITEPLGTLGQGICREDTDGAMVGSANRQLRDGKEASSRRALGSGVSAIFTPTDWLSWLEIWERQGELW
jgi:hypothetical protein